MNFFPSRNGCFKRSFPDGWGLWDCVLLRVCDSIRWSLLSFVSIYWIYPLGFFQLQSSSSSDAVDQLLNKTREGEKSRDVVKEKTESTPKESIIEAGSNTNSNGGSSKPNSPSISPSMSNSSEQKRGPEVTSQGVQTSGPGSKQDKEDKEEKKDTSEWVFMPFGISTSLLTSGLV